jgi:hypothetical protein
MLCGFVTDTSAVLLHCNGSMISRAIAQFKFLGLLPVAPWLYWPIWYWSPAACRPRKIDAQPSMRDSYSFTIRLQYYLEPPSAWNLGVILAPLDAHGVICAREHLIWRKTRAWFGSYDTKYDLVDISAYMTIGRLVPQFSPFCFGHLSSYHVVRHGWISLHGDVKMVLAWCILKSQNYWWISTQQVRAVLRSFDTDLAVVGQIVCRFSCP